jgi:hypothetical protein
VKVVLYVVWQREENKEIRHAYSARSDHKRDG